MMETTLHVKGMSCGHCVSSVKGALEQLNGITSVEVNLNTGEVDVNYNDSRVTVEEMRNTIKDQGYDVVE